MTESSLSRRIRQHANDLPHTKAIKIHGNGLMEVGTPDLLVVQDGRAIWFETKVGRNKPSKIQEKRLEQWQAAGAIAVAVYTLDEALDVLLGRQRTAEDKSSAM